MTFKWDCQSGQDSISRVGLSQKVTKRAQVQVLLQNLFFYGSRSFGDEEDEEEKEEEEEEEEEEEKEKG